MTLECVGGPMDGQRVNDVGFVFVPFVTVKPVSAGTDALVKHAPGSGQGYYVTARGRYEWRPR